MQFSEISGTLLSGVRVSQLRMNSNELNIWISKLRVDIAFSEIIRGQLHIKKVLIERLYVEGKKIDQDFLFQKHKDKVNFFFPIGIQINEVSFLEISMSNDILLKFLEFLGKNVIHLENLKIPKEDGFNFPWKNFSLDLKGISVIQSHVSSNPFYADMIAQIRINLYQSFWNQPAAINGKKLKIFLPELRINAKGSIDNEMKIDLKINKSDSVDFRGSFFLKNASIDSIFFKLQDRRNNGSILAFLNRQFREDFSDCEFFSLKIETEEVKLEQFIIGTFPSTCLTTQSIFEIALNQEKVIEKLNVHIEIDSDSLWNEQKISALLNARISFEKKNPNSENLLDLLNFSKNLSLNVNFFDLNLNIGCNQLISSGSFSNISNALFLDFYAKNLKQLWPTFSGQAKFQISIQDLLERYFINVDSFFSPVHSSSGLNSLENYFQDPIEKISFSSIGEFRKTETDIASFKRMSWVIKILKINFGIYDFLLRNNEDMYIFINENLTSRSWRLGVFELRFEHFGIPIATYEHSISSEKIDSWIITADWGTSSLYSKIIRELLLSLLKIDDLKNVSLIETIISIAEDLEIPRGKWILSFKKLPYRFIELSFIEKDGEKKFETNISLQTSKKLLSNFMTEMNIRFTIYSNEENLLDSTFSFFVPSWSYINQIRLGGIRLNQFMLKGKFSNLSWLNLFVGRNIEVTGCMKIDISGRNIQGGSTQVYGFIQGSEIKIDRIDKETRLVDGSLDGYFDCDKFILKSFSFLNLPKFHLGDHKVREWIYKNIDQKKSYTNSKGQWNFSTCSGSIEFDLHQFPIIHRFDGFLIVSGPISISIPNFSEITVNGDLRADIGFMDLELASRIRNLDDDVFLITYNPNKNNHITRNQLILFESVAINLNVGNNFRLTGLGLDTGLLGSVQLRLKENRKFIGFGVLNTTKDATIEVYGQRLNLSRGCLVFQGNIDNPSLDMEALRTGEQIESGIHVSGTIHKPNVRLVSYPNVEDLEKLSWLILGSGTRENIGNAELLASLGTILLNGKQQFLRQFGLSNFQARNSPIVSSIGLLSGRTFGEDIKGNNSIGLTTQFLVASKNFSNGVSLSIEQAIAGSETLGRISYKLSKFWTFDIKGGSRNGIALVYRTFLDD